MAVTFRAGEEKKTTANEFEIEVQTKPVAPGGLSGRLVDLFLRPITLNPGTHSFRLVVEDQQGNLSAPATVVVHVVGGQ